MVDNSYRKGLSGSGRLEKVSRISSLHHLPYAVLKYLNNEWENYLEKIDRKRDLKKRIPKPKRTVYNICKYAPGIKSISLDQRNVMETLVKLELFGFVEGEPRVAKNVVDWLITKKGSEFIKGYSSHIIKYSGAQELFGLVIKRGSFYKK